MSAEPQIDGKSCILHLRETNGTESTLNLINGMNEKGLTALEVDVTGKPAANPSLVINPLESKFYRIIFTNTEL